MTPIETHEFVERMARYSKALGDPTRLRIIRILASNMEDKICVTELAKILGMTQPAASQHIKTLKNTGLLEAKREGYRVYYYINIDVLQNYKKDFDKMYEMAFEKCKHYANCETKHEPGEKI